MCEDNILDFTPQGMDEADEDSGSTLTLVDEEGNEVEMAVLDVVEHKGEEYVILLPVENIASGDMEVAVLRIEYDEEADEYAYVTGDEPEFDEVFEKFHEQLQQELSTMDDLQILDEDFDEE
ncbi:MAG: DUF1292 domain-containing protein [Acutalibacteraceae bacterium]